MRRLTKATFIFVTLALIGAILGIVGIVAAPWKSYCFIAFPVLLSAFLLLKKIAGKDREEFKDTPWGL